MTVAVIVLAVALAGLIGSIVWLVRRALELGEDLAAARTDAGMKTVEAERAKFAAEQLAEHDKQQSARASALEEVVSHEADTKPNSDLAPDDIAGRLTRLQHAAAAVPGAAGAGSEVPAEPVREVLDAPAARETKTAAVPGPERHDAR